MDRRTFFKGAAGSKAPIRPPYSKGEVEFFDACTGCGACVEICPTNILITSKNDRPEVDFSSAYCTFCTECAKACPTDALQLDGKSPWPLKASLNSDCLENKGVACRACEFECGQAAIRFRPQLGGKNHVSIDQDRCTGCGECIGICPLEAIAIGEAKPSPDNAQISTETSISPTTIEEYAR